MNGFRDASAEPDPGRAIAEIAIQEFYESGGEGTLMKSSHKQVMQLYCFIAAGYCSFPYYFYSAITQFFLLYLQLLMLLYIVK